MTCRVLLAAAVATGAALSGCFELSAPSSGLSAISTIQAAWPSVADGDVLRDAAGNPAPLRVDAYDGAGNLVSDATVTYVALDAGLHVDAAGIVHGEHVRNSPARIVAQVRRESVVLQTPELRIDVVPQPDSATPANDTTFAEKIIPRLDATPIPSDSLKVTVLTRVSGAPAPVRSWIVRYDLVEPAEAPNGQEAAVFPGPGNARLALDTTDGAGLASRTVTLRPELVPKEAQVFNVVVRATVRGAGAGGADRTITFRLPFRRAESAP